MKKILFFILISCSAAAQDSVMYTREYKFKEGIYPDYEAFKKNNPIPKAKIISTQDKSKLGFLGKVVSMDKVVYLDSAGVEQTIKTNKIWGYYENNSAYINFYYNGDFCGFQKIQVIGSICHLTAEIVTRAHDSYYYDAWDYNNQPSYYKELRQFILDFATGAGMEFTVENMEKLLKRDEQLYAEFSEFSKKKKQQMIFVYLRKFNEKHPIYFPV